MTAGRGAGSLRAILKSGRSSIMDQIKDALAFLSQQAVKAEGIAVETVESEPEGVYLLRRQDGSIGRMLASSDWRRHTLRTPQDLAAFVARQERAEKDRSAVFVSENSIVFVFDIEDRRNIATCPLTLTPQWKALVGKPFASQGEIIRLLRIVFKDSLINSDQVILSLRKLSFKLGSSSEGDIDPNKRESFSRSATAGLEQEIPDSLLFEFPIFEGYRVKAKVACALQSFPVEAKLSIEAYPQALTYAMSETLEAIAELFRSKGMPPVFIGTP
jgi:hypothetical protein